MGKNAAVVIDVATGTPLMVIVPDHDHELEDLAFHPAGSIHVYIPMETYKISTHEQLQSIIKDAIAKAGL